MTTRSVIAEVQEERERQENGEGWTEEHDDEHIYGELSAVASCYALHASRKINVDRLGITHVDKEGLLDNWPMGWDRKWWKPSSPRRDLVKAAALIVAEIERLDRLEDTE